MVIKKKAGTFDVYQCELSFKELQAFQAAGQGAGDPIADEASKAIEWYFANEVPPPGVDEHPSKAAKEAGTTDGEIDAILPNPDGELAPGGAPEPEAEIEISPGAPDAPPALPPGAGEEKSDEVEAEEILPEG